MAIEKKYAGNGSKNMPEGEHLVTISDIKVGMSKKGQAMLTITFENEKEQTQKGFFVKELKFHMSQLSDLKEACGLAPNAAADELLGKKCGILLEEQAPDAEGKVYMRISGIGKASEVAGVAMPPPVTAAKIAEQSIPF